MALGTLRANESVDLTASVTETVSALHFDDGKRVTAGQTLVEMTNDSVGDLVVTHGSLRVRPGQVVTIRAVDEGGQRLETLLSQIPAATAAGTQK